MAVHVTSDFNPSNRGRDLPAARKLSSRDAAAYMGISKSYLDKMRLLGAGPNYIKVGRRVLYDIADLESWLAQYKRRSSSDVG